MSLLPESAYAALGLSPDTIRIMTTPKPKPSPIASPNLLQDAHTPEESLAPNESAITLYAELLLNIRTITLFASLRSAYTRATKVELSTDGCTITVTHENQSATIRLPIKAEGGGDAALSLPAKPPSKELTLRLQIEEKDGTNLLGTLLSEERKVNIVPWDGASLNNMGALEVRCRKCDGIVLRAGQVQVWKDLPNENWAEMMDFWHCHKPDEHHLQDLIHEETVGQKGYAAGNRLKAAEQVGFVDLASFLLKQADCVGAETSSQSSTQQSPQDRSIYCQQCNNILGTTDEASSGWRIQKWCVNISASSNSTAPAPYTIQKWIAARLLYLVENQGIRKFHVHADAAPNTSDPIPSLLLWVFTPDLFFSSSVSSDDRLDPTRSMKVFYQHQTWTAPVPGEPESAAVEDLIFSEELFEVLRGALEESRWLLPPAARMFQGWEVGLLERFDVGDVRAGLGEDMEMEAEAEAEADTDADVDVGKADEPTERVEEPAEKVEEPEAGKN